MQSLTLSSPAKLNLYLRVIGKLPGGYHRLITLFHRISLRDTLILKKHSRGFILSCSNPSLPTGSDNIVTKAYQLLEEKCPKIGGVSVYLDKKIPIGGGLAGGSSNAATFLLGMRKLYHLPLSLKDLVTIGARLGSDVPFFLYNVNQAVGEGRGHEIYPQPAKRRLWFVLVLFEQGLSTKRVYQSLPKSLPGLSLTKAKHIARIAFHFLEQKDLLRVARGLHNDLEVPAFRLNPSIQKMIEIFIQLGIPSAAMSGSGPTVFAILSDRNDAVCCARRLENFVSPKQIRICHSI